MMATIKVYACYTVKFYKHLTLNKYQTGRAPSAPVLDPPLFGDVLSYIAYAAFTIR